MRSFRKSHLSYDKTKVYEKLFDKEILLWEASREVVIKLPKNQKRKKALRKYKIEDKVKFKRNFDRFWFRFIAFHTKELLGGKYNQIFEMIDPEFNHFVSRGFEVVCSDFVKALEPNISSVSTYWDKNVEFDIYGEDSDGRLFIGECKWSNHRTNKNIVSLLKRKCELAHIEPLKIYIFSKSGFSAEFYKSCPKEYELYDLQRIKGEFLDR